jgi:cation:H+ antiporter
VAALAVIAVASRVFVGQLGAIGLAMSLPPHLVALVLSPVATELPETLNALIWVRQGKERLALANISGAMMIQATIPSALAIFATPWLFDRPLIVSGVLTAAAIAYLWWLFRQGRVDARRLLPVGLLYGVFAAFVAWHFAR